jgi:hypothetical protein
MELCKGTESIRMISIINGSNRIIPKSRKPKVRISSERRDQSQYLQYSREFYFPQAMQFIHTHTHTHTHTQRQSLLGPCAPLCLCPLGSTTKLAGRFSTTWSLCFANYCIGPSSSAICRVGQESTYLFLGCQRNLPCHINWTNRRVCHLAWLSEIVLSVGDWRQRTVIEMLFK